MCNCRKISALHNILFHQKGRLTEPKKMISLIRRSLSSRARLYGWGSSDAGELGPIHKATDVTSPVSLDAFQNVKSASCGYGTTFFHKNNLKAAVGLGLNSFGQLGIEDDINAKEIDLDDEIIQISCGRVHTLLWSRKGVFVAGCNIQGQCGLSKDLKSVKRFQQVPLPFDHRRIKQIACGLDHSLILTAEGTIYSTGLGSDGQTGTNSYNCQYEFSQVAGQINETRVTQISTSTDTCLALTDQNNVFGWGNNEQGQISWKNKEKQIAKPTQLDSLPKDKKIKQVVAGGSFSAFIADGNVFVTGYGALGIGKEQIEANAYYRVELEPMYGKIARAANGPDYLAAVTETGKLLTWGRGNHGRLGHGDMQDQFTPKMVLLPGSVVDFACGIDHMVAIVDCEEPLM